jgi:hypothetical protein
LFRWFAQEAAYRYKAPPITLTDDAANCSLPTAGRATCANCATGGADECDRDRQREIDAEHCAGYLPKESTALVPQGAPAVVEIGSHQRAGADLQVPVRYEERPERPEGTGESPELHGQPLHLRTSNPAYREELIMPQPATPAGTMSIHMPPRPGVSHQDVDHTEVEESLSIEEKEKELIRKAW